MDENNPKDTPQIDRPFPVISPVNVPDKRSFQQSLSKIIVGHSQPGQLKDNKTYRVEAS